MRQFLLIALENSGKVSSSGQRQKHLCGTNVRRTTGETAPGEYIPPLRYNRHFFKQHKQRTTFR